MNTAGLAVGMAVCLLMLLFVQQHWRKDRFHTGADRIHRVTTVDADGRLHAASPPRLASRLDASFSGAEAVAQLRHQANGLVHREGDRFELPYLYAGPSFFEVFDGFEIQHGRAASLLEEPGTAVLTAPTARKLFDDRVDVVGKQFRLQGMGQIQVAGVLEERPSTQPTHLDFAFLLSAETGENAASESGAWHRLNHTYTYVQLHAGTTPATAESHLDGLARRVEATSGTALSFQLQSLSDIALGSERVYNDSIQTATIPAFLASLLVGLGLVVLAAAAFNYVNLTVSRSLRRAKEVGVRKTLGAHQWQVGAQLLTESLVVCWLATGAAILLLFGLVPLFKGLYAMRFIDPGLTFRPFRDPSLLLLLFGFGTVVGVLSGVYPAYMLSRPQAASVLSGESTPARIMGGFLNMSVRKGLVGLQLVFAIVLTVSTVFLYQQASSFRSADHGFATAPVFHVDLHDRSYALFQQRMRTNADVAAVTGMGHVFLGGRHDYRPMTRVDQPADTLKNVEYFPVDQNVLETLDVSLAASLPNVAERLGSKQAVVVNAAAMDRLGVESPTAALGRSVTVGGVDEPLTVAAVASQVWFEGMQERDVDPFVLHHRPEALDHALVRVKSGRDVRTVMQEGESVWATLGSPYPYTAETYSDVLDQRYGPTEDLSLIAGSVALLAVLIVCLGLAALAAYTAQTRMKEIGVRKALGATEWSVVGRLSRGYAALIVAAVVLGVPLAWWLNAQIWQPLFSRSLSPNVFLLIGSVLGLTALVLGVVVVRVRDLAVTNPAHVLRDT